MKQKILGFGLISLTILAFIVPYAFGASHSKAPKGDPVRSVRVLAQGMDEKKIEKASVELLKHPGILDVKYQKRSNEVSIRFNVEKINIKTLDANLRQAGFTTWYH
ncbi:MAG: hypothetical protein C5B54_12085 [Acidobacteria bacterium]|nr:MAG: hypothetical protein C5B54_12085 [Acidobacteriota bacterium]